MRPSRLATISYMLLLLASCMSACDTPTANADKKPDHDTLTLSFEELKSLLPTLPDYEPESPPNGEFLSKGASGGKVSFAKQIFLKENERVYIEIIDYKNAPERYTAMMNMYGFQTPHDNDFEKVETLSAPLPETEIVARTGKTDQQSRLTYGIGKRVMINLVGDEQAADINKLKKIAAFIPMDSILTKIKKTPAIES